MLRFCVMCFFFFSSRRRHTRCSRDWSSDVCSSDLYRSIAGEQGLLVTGGSDFHGDAKPQLLVGTGYGNLEIPADLLDPMRSEEHTSELQSRLHLVCRLLLEKKKNVSWPDMLVQ